MLRLIPGWAHRLAYRAAHDLRVRWWRLREPRLNGCRVLALDAQGRVLLVRHSYGAGLWLLPGGGVKRHEDAVAAARRELREETGCVLEQAREIEVVEEPLQGARNRVHLVAGRTKGTPRADRREIVDARFCAPDALPTDTSERLRASLPRWLAQI